MDNVYGYQVWSNSSKTRRNISNFKFISLSFYKGEHFYFVCIFRHWVGTDDKFGIAKLVKIKNN